MGANVTFIAIRKKDYVPYFEAYLGGNKLVEAVSWSENWEDFIKLGDSTLLKLKDTKQVENFLTWHEDDFYLGNYAQEVLSFVQNENEDDYVYFIRIE